MLLLPPNLIQLVPKFGLEGRVIYLIVFSVCFSSRVGVSVAALSARIRFDSFEKLLLESLDVGNMHMNFYYGLEIVFSRSALEFDSFL